MIICKQLFRKMLLILFVLSFFILFISCGDLPNALDAMNEFKEAYGIEKTVYSKSLPEGDSGYADSDFFYNMYGDGEDSVCDYAVLLLSDLDTVGECAVFICYTEYDAILVTDICRRRMDLLKSLMGSVDVSFLSDSFIKRYGRVVVMCALSDNESAQQIFDRIF